MLQPCVFIDLKDLLFSHHSLLAISIGRNLQSFIVSQTMATAALAAPHFIQEDFFVQYLEDSLHHLERQRTQAQDAYKRQASDDIAAKLLQYSTEMEELRRTMRDRLLALTLGRGDEVDYAPLDFFAFDTSHTGQAQGQTSAITGHTRELDESTTGSSGVESDEERTAPNRDPRQPNPRETPVVQPQPHDIPPRVVASTPGFPGFLLPE